MSLTKLPAELQLHIISFLDHPDFVRLTGTNRYFRTLPTKQVRKDSVYRYAHDYPRLFENVRTFFCAMCMTTFNLLHTSGRSYPFPLEWSNKLVFECLCHTCDPVESSFEMWEWNNILALVSKSNHNNGKTPMADIRASAPSLHQAPSSKLSKSGCIAVRTQSEMLRLLGRGRKISVLES